MFEIFDSLFGAASPSSSIVSKNAPVTVTSDRITNRRTIEKAAILESHDDFHDRRMNQERNNGNYCSPHRGRQEQRDRMKAPCTKSHANAFVVSHSCPPPLHRTGELKAGVKSTAKLMSKKSGCQDSYGGKLTKGANTGAQCRDHSCPPALTLSKHQLDHQQQRQDAKSTGSRRAYAQIRTDTTSTKKTRDLVSVARDRRKRLSSFFGGTSQQHVGSIN